MKKLLTALSLIIIFILLLTNPALTLTGAKNGIELWYQAVLPALLPFMIISNIIVKSDMSEYMSVITRPLTKLLRLPPACGYAVFAGLFFGYPACATVSVQMYQKNLIDKNTANYCSCVFNNVSPAFLIGYVCIGILENENKIPLVAGLFYIIILLSAILIRYTIFRKKQFEKTDIQATYQSDKNIADSAIVTALYNVSKLCGYIVLFSIITVFVSKIPVPCTDYLCGLLEVTTGTGMIGPNIKLLIPLLCFGGICGIFQTFGMDTEGIISRKQYILSKIISYVIAVLVCTII